MLTAATVRRPAANPLPEHLTVTPTGWPQVQQAKSRLTSSSGMVSLRLSGAGGEPQSNAWSRVSKVSGRRPFLQATWVGSLAALALGAVLGARLLAVRDPLGVDHAADDVVAHARQVADAAAADQHDRVLLEVVPLAGDVRRHIDAVGQPHARHLAEG